MRRRHALLICGAVTILSWYGLIILFKFIATGVEHYASR